MNADAPLHANCVAVGDTAVLIFGSAGSGKSSLSLQLMALGACLVADDRVILTKEADQLVAHCPAPLRGLIEARGVGVLNAETRDSARVALAIDMDQVETDRIPTRREVTLLGCRIPLLYKADNIHLASAILQWMRAGRSER